MHDGRKPLDRRGILKASSALLIAPLAFGVWKPGDHASRNACVKTDRFVSVLEFGAVADAVFNDGAWTGSDNTSAFAAAFASSRSVLVPTGAYLIHNNLDLPDNSWLKGDGRNKTSIIYMAPTSGAAIDITDRHNVTIEGLHIDANRLYRLHGYVATAGAGISISNSGETFRPRHNNVILKDLLVTNPGFVGVFCYNAHGVSCQDVKTMGDRDSGFAFVNGCSEIRTDAACYSEGFDFGFSLSSNGGRETVGAVGLVRDSVLHGTARATKPGSQGWEVDGCRNITIRGAAILNGGAYGLRVIPSGVTPEVVDVYDSDLDVDVVFERDSVRTYAISVAGQGDIRSTRISGSVTTLHGKAMPKTDAFRVDGGVSVRFEDLSASNVGTALNINNGTLAGAVDVVNANFSDNFVGVNSASKASRKLTLTLEGVRVLRSGFVDYILDSGTNLILTGTELGTVVGNANHVRRTET